MAHNSKQGFLSSLFGNRKPKEPEESAGLESRHRLEERIQQILAEQVEVPRLLTLEEDGLVLMAKEEEAEPEIELLPISASVLSSRKTLVSAPFMPLTWEGAARSYVANQR
jgi:hypothetical protein